MRPAQIVKLALENPELLGAAAGGAMPAASLYEYLKRDLPAYRKLLNDAPEVAPWMLESVLRPGDIGLGGVYNTSGTGAMTSYLNMGSLAASGGPGTHGQIVGPRVERLIHPETGKMLDPTVSAARKAKALAKGYRKKKLLSLFHGGQHNGALTWGAQRRYVEGILAAMFPDYYGKKSPGLWQSIKARLADLPGAPGRYRDLMRQDAADVADVLARRGSKTLLHTADTVMEDAKNYIGKENRPYLYMRSVDGAPKMTSPTGKAFRSLTLREAPAPYDIFGATGAGIKSVFLPSWAKKTTEMVPTFKQELARTGGRVADAIKNIRCDASGHHCASMPAAIGQRLNMVPRDIAARDMLPSQIALSSGLKPVAIVGKSQMLKDLGMAAKLRTTAGIGATALSAGGGYFGTKMIGNAFGNRMKSLLSQRLGT